MLDGLQDGISEINEAKVSFDQIPYCNICKY
jgi:hypothetical protein